MSAATFQSLMAQLVIDPAFRQRVQASGLPVDADLDARERQRLRHIAASPGLDINRTLHKGFRFGKLRALLPLTCALLQGPRLHTAVARFWALHPPRSFYFLPEAIEFCDFLLTQPTHSKYLHEVVGFERAHLELQRARTDELPPQTVHFQHDPSKLLGPLAQGKVPLGVPLRPCTAVGTLDGQGQAQWVLQDGAGDVPTGPLRRHRAGGQSPTSACARSRP